jgi:hypothetical protein
VSIFKVVRTNNARILQGVSTFSELDLLGVEDGIVEEFTRNLQKGGVRWPALLVIGLAEENRRSSSCQAAEISNETHYSVNTDGNHKTCETSDEDPRPAK